MQAWNWGRRLNTSRVGGIHVYYTSNGTLVLCFVWAVQESTANCILCLLIGGVGSIFSSKAIYFCISAPYFASACAFDSQTS